MPLQYEDRHRTKKKKKETLGWRAAPFPAANRNIMLHVEIQKLVSTKNIIALQKAEHTEVLRTRYVDAPKSTINFNFNINNIMGIKKKWLLFNTGSIDWNNAASHSWSSCDVWVENIPAGKEMSWFPRTSLTYMLSIKIEGGREGGGR